MPLREALAGKAVFNTLVTEVVFNTLRDPALWDALRKDFNHTPFLAAVSQNPILSFATGVGDGLSFHYHEANWLAQVRGRKLWFAYPSTGPALPNRLKDGRVPATEIFHVAGMQTCVTEPGQVIRAAAAWRGRFRGIFFRGTKKSRKGNVAEYSAE